MIKMTVKESADKTPARKGTVGKAWKESLRKACLDRARKRRLTSKTFSDILKPARLLIEEEMVQQGVSLVSPCIDSHSTPQLRSLDNSLTTDEPMHATNLLSAMSAPESTYCISEDELFDLLAEVEAEIERTESSQLDEMLEFANGSQEDLENRIAEYQEWEHESLVRGIICPLCHEADLTQLHDRFVCPNSMDQSCPFDLANTQGLSLEDLRERLQVAYDEHASYCNGNLSFEMAKDNMTGFRSLECQSLVATCSSCESTLQIV